MTTSPISVRAPVRVSFGGGGTDLAAYYEKFGGFVLSTAISRYCHVVVGETADGGSRITSSNYHLWQDWDAGECPVVEEPLVLPKAAIEWFWHRGLRERGVDVFLSSEVPPGTGLGSSSAMTVALIRGLSAYLGVGMEPLEVADLACRLEIDRLGMPIGKQDQYASAYGGLNSIWFAGTGVQVEPLQLPDAMMTELGSRLLLFSTGQSRHSSHILGQQRADTTGNAGVLSSLHQIKDLALSMRSALGRGALDAFGELLDQAWQLKRGLSDKVSSTQIDGWYSTALEAGALGGKITGAGGGGFLLLYCAPKHQHRVRQAMTRNGLQEMAFDFDTTGVQVLTVPGETWPDAASNVVSEHVLVHKRLRRAQASSV